MPEKKKLFDGPFSDKQNIVHKSLLDSKSKNHNIIRQRLENLYDQHFAFLDKGFPQKFFEETNQRYFELSLAHFLRQTFALKLPKKEGKGPDFSFKHEGKTIWIEVK
jgi:hypothetical protein